MEILLIIAVVVFHLYLILNFLRFKIIPPSISDTYYMLPKNVNFWFTLFCWGYGIPIAIVSVNFVGTALMFYAGCSICFVGAASAFKDNSLTKKVHMWGASIAVILSQLSLIFEYSMWYMSLISILIGGSIILLGKNKVCFKNTYIYWAEFVMIEIVFLAIALNIF